MGQQEGDNLSILDTLNSAQLEAVEHPGGPQLVLAGPGSGKTRVLTHRVAYLVGERGIKPWAIMAVTFTNKAAREMKDRLSQLIGSQLEALTVGTFHSICVRILRRELSRIGKDPSFVIFDRDDQLRLTRQAIAGLNLNDKDIKPPSVLSAISHAKGELATPDSYQPRTYWEEIASRVYAKYQDLLAANNALDFDDLLMTTVQLFTQAPDVLEHYQRRYQHILVDEFQDTNMVQYDLVKRLAGGHRNLFVVGDPDQSIYSWRNADIRNILNFERDFPDATLTLLEQNYRSTKTIVKAANNVISRNQLRKGKTLWTAKGQGAQIAVLEAYDEAEEARFVALEIQRLSEENICPMGACAVMYRTNAQSRAIEDFFVRFGIPYRLVGATRFYARAEIKDILSYLRLIHNPADAVSLRRIVNLPARGIGKKTLGLVERWAEKSDRSLWDALEALADIPGEGDDQEHRSMLDSRAARALGRFISLIRDLREAAGKVDVPTLLDRVLDRTGYENYIRDRTEEGEDRWQNILELRNAAQEYAELGSNGLATFLEEVALVSDVDNLEDTTEAPTLLTLHMAKGLEFPTVFVVGLNEGILPHNRSLDDPDSLEEERRLFYVGITRAKDRLYLLHTFRQATYGTNAQGPSRFLMDIPPDLIESPGQALRMAQPSISRPREPSLADPATDPEPIPSFSPGERVRHPRFGDGVVVSSQAKGEDAEITVAFEGKGVKRLLASLARLEPV
jgi:DNA helicase-2/ATP-dependent DNA helicase PcrA